MGQAERECNSWVSIVKRKGYFGESLLKEFESLVVFNVAEFVYIEHRR